MLQSILASPITSHHPHQPSESLVSQVPVAQLTHPTRNDWGQTIKHDLEEIGLQIDDINNMSKKYFGTLVKNKTEAMAFEYLNDKKLHHKKVRKLNHTNLKMADYLKPNNQNIKQTDAQLLFQLKTKTVIVKGNHSSSFIENMNCVVS